MNICIIKYLIVILGKKKSVEQIFNMKKINYFFASLFGFIPSFFITNSIGAGLNTYVARAETFSIIELIMTPKIYLPILFYLLHFFL